MSYKESIARINALSADLHHLANTVEKDASALDVFKQLEMIPWLPSKTAKKEAFLGFLKNMSEDQKNGLREAIALLAGMEGGAICWEEIIPPEKKASAVQYSVIDGSQPVHIHTFKREAEKSNIFELGLFEQRKDVLKKDRALLYTGTRLTIYLALFYRRQYALNIFTEAEGFRAASMRRLVAEMKNLSFASHLQDLMISLKISSTAQNMMKMWRNMLQDNYIRSKGKEFGFTDLLDAHSGNYPLPLLDNLFPVDWISMKAVEDISAFLSRFNLLI